MLRIYPPITTHYPPVNTKKQSIKVHFDMSSNSLSYIHLQEREREGREKKKSLPKIQENSVNSSRARTCGCGTKHLLHPGIGPFGRFTPRALQFLSKTLVPSLKEKDGIVPSHRCCSCCNEPKKFGETKTRKQTKNGQTQ